MITYAAHAVAVAGAVMLVVSGAAHVWNRRSLLASLHAHDLLRPRVARAAAVVLPVGMLVVGALAFIAVVTPLHAMGLRGPAVAACGVLYTAMSLYLVVLLRIRSGSQCACFGRAEPVTQFSLARTATPALACAWVLAHPLVPAVTGGATLMLVLGLAVGGVGVLAQGVFFKKGRAANVRSGYRSQRAVTFGTSADSAPRSNN